MKKWTYKVIEFEAKGFFGGNVVTEEIEKTLNELGNDGWEVIHAFTTAESQGRTKKIIYNLKKEVIL